MRRSGSTGRVWPGLFVGLFVWLATGRISVVEAVETPSSHPRVLILGGGSSHDFAASFGKTDAETLRAAGDMVEYTESFVGLRARLKEVDTVVQASNQAMPDAEARRALMEFVARGGGLVVVHAGTWYNWPDWPEYNRTLVGGGTREHDRLGRFAVMVAAPDHAVMRGVPAHFEVEDELYHQEMTAVGSAEVLATAHSELTGKTYPSVWVLPGQKGKIVCITLGHDERVHTLPAYRTLLRNAVGWTADVEIEQSSSELLPSSSLWKMDVAASSRFVLEDGTTEQGRSKPS